MLLTDEEINEIDNELVDIPEFIDEADEYKAFLFSRRYYAKAQLKKLVTDMGDLIIWTSDDGGLILAPEAQRHWRSLQEEAGVI